MAGKQRLSVKHVIAALQRSAGLQTEAAKMLGCHRSTVARYLQRYPKIREALDDTNERMGDIGESQVFKAIQQGDLPTVRWYLARKHPGRGGRALRDRPRRPGPRGHGGRMAHGA
ncbi:MAG: helix-turn-helix domain-containing protein [Rhodobacteraceae bacterium]|nr:helix-turn-helix domain-containing protein [Paracoccaceae bacterium]